MDDDLVRLDCSFAQSGSKWLGSITVYDKIGKTTELNRDFADLTTAVRSLLLLLGKLD